MSAAAPPAPPVNPDRPETGHSAGKSSLSSKSDPNQALRGEEAVYSVGSSGFSLRSMQHRDREGKVITEPDLSNPTRYRFERPLDTIRSFEAAIERRRREAM
ncbi:hypothetical protein AtubIFM55763_005683 [Aspergillus tubingensis]|uniref:Uncharacterized protein n=4 Tax=Aspergillus subgen. Circumdati TaxID=2720871 RepID=A0A1L9NIW9_ASPTC|nr:hypothetical protein BO87DRAFT_367489 [Aspergillus neoniger CBS 115656]XP_025537973.1 hypothetical protein BO79DRAFT_256633 [Aspergillus costaricaensis CBS 115574]XP_035361396.1 uncharacterized protein AtWU_10399 [Aspergillus tubingensis]OJI89163.1 hypothetical protein ASPTUDRAFT_50178 [Aspergillus tubingensis CBS 134.48]PYH30157.1 hypothetical protein BO87DRAFT_367489 [Aspergillus neoniger CBS 115656]RAK87138.1 hypothetical protein BO79DRAFT_256633 [Aspergillus costaricaensis CBS 115574]G